MQFRWGAIPEDPGFEPSPSEWTSLREPNPWLAQLLAAPIAIAIVVTLLFVWPMILPHGASGSLSVVAWVILIVLLIPAHELVHVLTHPGQGRSSATLVGFWPKTLLFWAHYEGELTRNRFVIVLISPFLALTLVPVATCALLKAAPLFVVIATLLNGVFACVDLLGGIMLLTQVPAAAIVRNKGYKTWWRSPA